MRVAVRLRPPNQRELAGEGNGVCVDVVPADGIVKVGSDRAFTFDVAFSMEATQAQVFDKIGVDLVGWVLGGYNASVFAYGQTSSGKTHSMMGARDSEVLRGLIPRIISLLWECVQAFLNENSKKHDCVLKASYLEIYNEEIRDLLSNCKKLKLRNDPKKGIFASGLTMFPLKSGEEAMECIERGAQLRSVAQDLRQGRACPGARPRPPGFRRQNLDAHPPGPSKKTKRTPTRPLGKCLSNTPTHPAQRKKAKNGPGRPVPAWKTPGSPILVGLEPRPLDQNPPWLPLNHYHIRDAENLVFLYSSNCAEYNSK